MSNLESEGATPPEGESRPEWLEAQFENPEAQARAYTDARTEMKRVQSELALERERFNTALASMSEREEPPAPAWNAGVDPTVAAYARAGEDGDAATQLAIQMQLTQAVIAQQLQQFEERLAPQVQQATQQDRELALRMAEQQVAGAFGERWGELAPKISERLSANRGLLESGPVSVEGYAQVLTDQARLIEYDRLTALERAQNEERAAKIAAQTLGNGVGRVPTDSDEKKQAWSQIASATPRGDYGKLVGG